MAYFDSFKAAHDKECEEKYKQLKEFINSSDTVGGRNEFFLAFEHIQKMELKLESQEKKIKEYQNFFGLLKKFLPSSSSIHDVIG